jgi:hypothetical protein
MRHSRSAICLLAPALVWICSGNATAQNAAASSSTEQHVLYLNPKNAGQHVAATVGQSIQITLLTIGPGQYGAPQISSSAIRFEGVEFAKLQIPAGPTQVYRFRAASDGEAQIKIPHEVKVESPQGGIPYKDPNPTFVATIRVHGQPKR